MWNPVFSGRFVDIFYWKVNGEKIELYLPLCSRTKRNTLTPSTATWTSTAPCTAPALCTFRATSRTTASWAAETCSSSSGKPGWVSPALNYLTLRKKMTLQREGMVLIRWLWKPETNSHGFPFHIFLNKQEKGGPANLQNIEDTQCLFHKPWPFFMCRGCEICFEHSCNRSRCVTLTLKSFFEWSFLK